MKPAILKKLIELAEREREQAAGRRTQASSARNTAHTTLGSLEQYRQNHRRNRAATLGGLPGASGLAIHSRFSGRLDQAIDAQQAECTRLEHTVGERSAELRRAQARLQALRALERRRERAARRRAEGAEQTAQDDLSASRRHLQERHR